MPIVAVKNKFQVVIPQRVRDEIGIEIGDMLEARAENGKIIFEPKSGVDRAPRDEAGILVALRAELCPSAGLVSTRSRRIRKSSRVR